MRTRAAAVVAVALLLPAAGCGREAAPGTPPTTAPASGPASDRPEPLDADQLAAASAAAAFLRGPSVPPALQDAEVGEVRVRGRQAAVQVVRPGATRPVGTIALVRSRGVWTVADAPRG